jgi:hypothetical protein
MQYEHITTVRGSWMDNPRLLARRRLQRLTYGKGTYVLDGVWVERSNVYEHRYIIGLLGPETAHSLDDAIEKVVQRYENPQHVQYQLL